MFSSTDDSTATNPFHPQFPAASSAFHGGTHQTLLPQLQENHYLFPHNMFPNTHMLVSSNNNNNNVNSKPLNSYVFPSCRRRTTGRKKDRHTKILTAQGPRDRRVRLSICIARKFFDLQDTLGFDKPSKTLNWLFSQSKLAIEELFHATTTTKMAVEDSHYKKKFELQQTVSEDSQEMGKRAKDSPNDSEEEEEETIGVITNLAKHSRAKARERARARTIKKMYLKELSEAKMLPSPLIKPPLYKNEIATKESITPRICSVWDIPQHLMMPKDLGLGHINGYSHNVSSSQVLQVCRKSWGCSDHNYQT